MTDQEIKQAIENIEKTGNDSYRLLHLLRLNINRVKELNQASNFRIRADISYKEYQEYEQEMLDRLDLVVLCFRRILRVKLFSSQDILEHNSLRNTLRLIFLERPRFPFSILERTRERLSSKFWEACTAEEMERVCEAFSQLVSEQATE